MSTSVRPLDLLKQDLAQWSFAQPTSSFLDAVAHFLLSQRSAHTRRNYARDLQSFQEFFEDNLNSKLTQLEQISERVVLLWKVALEGHHQEYATAGRRIVHSSVARKLCSLSSLMEFAKRRHLIKENVVAWVPRPKIKRTSKTNALTFAEVQKILNFLEEASQIAPTERLRVTFALRFAVLHTLLTVGMRVDELCELRIADFEVTNDFARLHMVAKGGETHAPIIHQHTVMVLQNYLERFRKNAAPDEFLFVRARNSKTNKLTQAAIYQMITLTAKEVGIDKKISPHSCRATLATLLHTKGVPIGQIQELLNHKQITTTAIYLKKADEIKEAAALKIDLYPVK